METKAKKNKRLAGYGVFCSNDQLLLEVLCSTVRDCGFFTTPTTPTHNDRIVRLVECTKAEEAVLEATIEGIRKMAAGFAGGDTGFKQLERAIKRLKKEWAASK